MGETTRRRGFTIAELAAVLAAAVILAALGLPGCRSSGRGHRATQTQARVANLATGATTFRLDYGFNPGQKDAPAAWPAGPDNATYRLMRTQLDAGTLTGSQVLARTLFADRPDGDGFPKSNYAWFQPGETLDTVDGKANTLVDCWPRGDTMAICYYPSRGAGGGLGQYKEKDNIAYTAGHVRPGAPADAFVRTIRDPGTGGPYCDGEFLIFAAGADRTYLTEDDPSNFAGL